MRVFLACFLHPASAGSLAGRIPVVPGMRPVPAENLHVTLHFLGSVDAARTAEIRALAATLPDEGLVTRVRSLDGFPKPQRARVLVARLEDPDGCLKRWHERLVERWPTGEARRFAAHTSLARSRRPVRLPRLPELDGLVLELDPPAAYVSDTLPEGARYRRLD